MKKKNSGAMWECSSCGKVEYGKLPPDECDKCWKNNSFTEVPEDMQDEMESHVLEEIRSASHDDMEDYE